MNLTELKRRADRGLGNRREQGKPFVVNVYVRPEDMGWYEAIARKYPSKREGSANITAFLRDHAEEIING